MSDRQRLHHRLRDRVAGLRVLPSRQVAVPRRRTADDWPELIKLLKDERKRVMPCSFGQFCAQHEVDYMLLRSKASDLADLLDAAHAAAVEKDGKEKAIGGRREMQRNYSETLTQDFYFGFAARVST